MTSTTYTTDVTPGTTLSRVSADSRKRIWAGRIVSALPVLFLLMDGVMKLALAQPVLDTMPQLGIPVTLARTIGIVEVACLLVYLVPQTAVLGAILLTGYLGGAIATHVRLQNPLFTHVLFPIYLAVPLWLGLWLRDARLRALVPFRR